MTKAQDGVHLLYKYVGETPLECVERFRKEHNLGDISMTYAGRLDPMAEGLLLVLSGDAISKKQEYLNVPKTYLFQILWGVSTDSLDIFGLVSGESSTVPDEMEVKTEICNSVGKFKQAYPHFSSKIIASRWKGKRLRPWVLPGETIVEGETHEVEIYSAQFLSREKIKGKEILQTILEGISLVTGDFRQKETMEEWKKIIEPEHEYVIDSVEMKVSRGFYVRQFVSDLAKKFDTCATTFHIKRIQIGNFSL